ncbi:ImmA/IrrE family metallo-endopeptidase [Myxococcota bacterium]
MSKKKKTKRKNEMPGEKILYDTDPEELWEARGEFLYDRMTPGVKKWMGIIEFPEAPKLPSDAVVFLSGVKNDMKFGVGMCTQAPLRGRKLGIVLLDDLDPAFVREINGTMRRHVPRTFTPDLLKKAWDAYLMQTFLHELGHWRYIRKNGHRGSEERHEQAAERFAWRWMERIYSPKVVAGVMGLSWVVDFVMGE